MSGSGRERGFGFHSYGDAMVAKGGMDKNGTIGLLAWLFYSDGVEGWAHVHFLEPGLRNLHEYGRNRLPQPSLFPLIN